MEKRRRSKRRSKAPPKSRLRLLKYEKRLNSAGLKRIAGVDEAGRGPLAGPVVAGAVILKRFDLDARIDDSKKLSPRARELAYNEILKNAHVGLGVVDERTIDAINIHEAARRAMAMAVKSLRVPPEHVLVDGRFPLDIPCKHTPIIKGDAKSISIAAASIVAKVVRDRLMRELDGLYPAYGFGIHKGYPTKAHKAALAKNGPSPAHRRSYAPVRAAYRASRIGTPLGK